MSWSTLTTSLTTEVNAALTAVVAVCVIVLGAKVGYRLYKRFLG